jgi:hypothetical protein
MAVCCLGMVLLTGGAAQAQSMRVEAQLIWATDDPAPPNPKYRPVDPDIAKRFVGGPFHWKYYYEVNRQTVNLTNSEGKRLTMSEHCVLDIKNTGTYRVQVKLFGDGKLVSTHGESLAKNHMLVLSGNSGNSTAWLVPIRQKPQPIASASTPH